MPSAVEMVAMQAGSDAVVDMTLSDALEKWVSKQPDKVKHPLSTGNPFWRTKFLIFV